MELTLYLRLAIALGLGMLVGFQREWAEKGVAGVRTFALISLLGALSGALAEEFGGWIVAAGVVALAAVLVMGNVMRMNQGEQDAGTTTEVAALLMFIIGATAAIGPTAAAVVGGGAMAVLLHWKRPLHEFTRNFDENEWRAIIRLVLIGLVILPILPNESYGPYHVVNPFQIWLMVVLIVGISVGAFIAYKLLGPRVGTLLAGVFGGLISSTATTVSYSRGVRHHKEIATLSAAVILMASAVVFLRVLFEIWLVGGNLLLHVGPPVAVMMLLTAAIAAVTFLLGQREPAPKVQPGDPADLKAAILFGLLYMAVLLGVAFAKDYFGASGLYAVSALSGLTDMDAITLSTMQLVNQELIEPGLSWRLILVGSMANMVFKGATVAVLGNRYLFVRVAAAFGLAIVGGVAILVFWP